MPKTPKLATPILPTTALSQGVNVGWLRRRINELERKYDDVVENNGRLQRKAELAEAMLDATSRINSSLSFSDVIRGILDSTQRLLKVRRSSLMLVDPALNALRVVGSRGLSRETMADLAFQRGEGLAGHVWARGEAVLIADASRDRRFMIRGGHKHAQESVACVPLNSGDGVVGVLSVDRSVQTSGVFTRDEVSYLNFLAEHAAVALRNAQLHEGISRRVTQLSALYEVGSALVSVLNADRLLTKIVEGVTRVTGAQMCSLMLLDDTTKTLTIRVAQGVPESVIKKIRIPLGQGISGYVGLTGQPLLIEDIEKHPLFHKKSKKKYSSRSLLSVPMEFRGKVIGVLNVNNKQPAGNVFTIDDQNLLTLFASQAAVTIENANLYRNLERLATTDGLTGLFVVRHFHKLLEEELKRAKRFQRPLSIIMLDIDHFKLLNDKYGHPAGDLVLREMAELVKTKGSRSQDIVARYGGEEFISAAVEAPKEIALRIAERLRAAVEAHEFVVSKAVKLRSTVSVGVSSFPIDAEPKDAIIKAADEALYHAKHSGRNQVAHWDERHELKLLRRSA